MLESKRLEYVRWNKDDYAELHKILGNPNVCKYLPGKDEKSDEEIKRWLDYYVNSFDDEHGTRIFKVLLQSTKEVIGYCGLGYVKEFDELEIMYGLNEDYWRKGYGLEMSLRMKELAKETGSTFIIALAELGNAGSNAILLKTGYEFVKQIELWGSELNYYEMSL